MFFGPVQNVADDPSVRTFGGKSSQASLDDPSRSLLEKRRRVHCTDEHATVEPVARVHHPARTLAQVVGGLRQAGRHQSDEVGLDLKVDVVGVDVVLGCATGAGGNTASQGAPGRQIGVPE